MSFRPIGYALVVMIPWYGLVALSAMALSRLLSWPLAILIAYLGIFLISVVVVVSILQISKILYPEQVRIEEKK